MRVGVGKASRWHAMLSGLLCVAAIAGGCATSVNSLTDKEIGQLGIKEVRVTFTPDSQIYWEAAEEEFAAQPTKAGPRKAVAATSAPVVTGSLGTDSMQASLQKASDRTALAQSPEGRAFLQRKVTEKITQRLNSQIKPKYNGSRPAYIEVQVVAFTIPSAAQKIVLGGTNMMGAVTTLRDAATGKELAKLDRLSAAATGNGWLGTAIEAAVASEPAEDRIVANYADQVEAWLQKKQ